MARRRFGAVDPNRREQPAEQIEINVPGIPSQPPSNNRRPIRPGVIIMGLLMVGLVCGLGIWGAKSFFDAQRVEPTAAATNAPWSPPTTNNGQPTAVGQGGSPVVNTAVPGAPREKLNVCIVNFGAYFPVLLIPNDNPVYELNVIPLNFYTDPYEDVVLPNIETYQFINPAGESEQLAMLTDGRCDILTTTTDVHAKHPGMGKLITIIGQSDGADKTVGWNAGVTPSCTGRILDIFNNVYQVDANGNKIGECVFAVADDSVGYFQLLSFLKLANISVDQVRIDTYPTPELAAQACVDRKADVCSGWVPAIDSVLDPAVVGENTTKTFVSSDALKTIYDGIFVSNNARQNKSAALLAFEEDWFRAVKMTQDDLPRAAEIIKNWTYQGMPTNEYTFVWDGSQVDDLIYWFETYAQASFNNQFDLLSNPNLMYEIYSNQRDVWSWSGKELDGGFDPASMLDMSFVQSLSSRTDLNTQNSFVNNTFSFFPEQLKPATRDALIQLPTLVEIVCPDVSFRAGEYTIDKNSAEYANLLGCGEQIKTLLNQSNLQILIIGSAAWPGPDYGQLYKNCGTKVLDPLNPNNHDYCWGVAVNRASFAQTAFTGDPLYIPPQRIALDYQLGQMCLAKDANLGLCTLQDSRFVTIQVKLGAGGLQ
jgi:hypothetical protein